VEDVRSTKDCWRAGDEDEGRARAIGMAGVDAVVVSRAGRANFVQAVCSVPASGGLIPSSIKLNTAATTKTQTPLSN
jgi:DNA-binding NarL/FixJ family response regulator